MEPKDIKVYLNKKNFSGETSSFGWETYRIVDSVKGKAKSIRPDHGVMWEAGVQDNGFPYAWIPDTTKNRDAIVDGVNSNTYFILDGADEKFESWGYERDDKTSKWIKRERPLSRDEFGVKTTRQALIKQAQAIGIPTADTFKMSKEQLVELVFKANSEKREIVED